MIARYETNDLHLAATLQCLGLELLEVDRSDPRRQVSRTMRMASSAEV